MWSLLVILSRKIQWEAGFFFSLKNCSWRLGVRWCPARLPIPKVGPTIQACLLATDALTSGLGTAPPSREHSAASHVAQNRWAELTTRQMAHLALAFTGLRFKDPS